MARRSTFPRARRPHIAAVVVPLVSVALTACAQMASIASESTAPASPTSETGPTSEPSPSSEQGRADAGTAGGTPTNGGPEIPPELLAEADALGQPDAAWYAVAHGVSVAEAVARLDAQAADRGKRSLITRELGESFGGLWIEHEPEFRMVIASTASHIPEGAARIAAALDAPVAWKTVAHSLADLESLQRDLGEAIWREGVPAGSSVDVKRNAVLLEVLDPAPLEPILSRLDYDDGMVIVEVVTGFPTLEDGG
ncbi:hypothetical protein ACFFGH_23865 [Lysobacter korlensis]|uniref:Lipoprotein n=1 Tax=Lysobacter korlensis TaxID=553636 RepID=A0ABV6RV74_9GAMM